jgi:prolyl oligopeptidase
MVTRLQRLLLPGVPLTVTSSTSTEATSQRFPDAKTDVVTNGIKTSTDEDAMIFYHRIGTDQCMDIPSPIVDSDSARIAEDILVHKDQDHPTWIFDLSVTEDEKYLVLSTSRDTARVSSTVPCSHDNDNLIAIFQKNLIWVADLKKSILGESIQWQKLFDSFDAEYT